MIKKNPTKSQLQRTSTSTRALATTANSVPAQSTTLCPNAETNSMLQKIQTAGGDALASGKKANDPLLKPTCGHPTFHNCSMTTNLPVTRKEPGHYCYKTTGIQSVCRFCTSSQHNDTHKDIGPETQKHFM
jgi:hypothetical protein